MRSIITDVESRKSIKIDASDILSHPRVLISDFLKTGTLIKTNIKKLFPTSFLKPVAIIQMTPEIKGELSFIEKRMLKELALVAGARAVFIYESEQRASLDDIKIFFKKRK